MRPSLFPSDDSLPTWLQTTLCLAVPFPFSIILWWNAGLALLTGHLEPQSGPEFGQYLFGNTNLMGHSAYWAAGSMILLGASFATMGLAFTRHAEDHRWLKALPWTLLPLSLVVIFFVRSPP